ncbi:hypothetical protein H4219_006129 [Mycoemilia scoparia]|uniref:Uncharacterized protein n=1 Tax=Mycoemilia scoparia TaxID=417184 RepID=A0A9W8DID6_9FUNG|nr:hypothetical protein H4219_006129 [Mycoemilia scoparia]
MSYTNAMKAFEEQCKAVVDQVQSNLNMATSLVINYDNDTGFIEMVSKIESNPDIVHVSRSHIASEYDAHVRDAPNISDRLFFTNEIFDKLEEFISESTENIKKKTDSYNSAFTNFYIACRDTDMGHKAEGFRHKLPVSPADLTIRYGVFTDGFRYNLDLYDNHDVDLFTNGQQFADYFFNVLTFSCYAGAYSAICLVALNRFMAGDIGRCDALIAGVRDSEILPKLLSGRH